MSSKRIKVEFSGSDGNRLAGLLEVPSAGARGFALFAHCFTCGKDIAAASRISRALVARGIAVMRFDFTGLGGSDGDFSNTNFSSNVEDLVAAADFLREQYQAPLLLIGHSLGGTAVLNAAHSIPECIGVVTIGSPAEAKHVAKQFSADLDEIDQYGEACVSLAGRQFKIKKQFLDDIHNQATKGIPELRKALLIFHSPVDIVVLIKEAEKIYRQAKHPKSFVSLDKADHLLSNKLDAEYVADTIATWSNRLIGETLEVEDRQSEIEKGKIAISERNHVFAQNIHSDSHFWLADEPVEVGGANLGPDPYEHLLAALGGCTSMTIRMYASRKKWPLDDIKVELSHNREHGEDCQQCDEEHPQIEVIRRTITLKGNLSDDQKQRLLEIADRCPVHRTLHGKLIVETELEK